MKRWLYLILFALSGPLWGLEKNDSADKPITLDPLLVRGTAQSSFGIDIRIYVDSRTHLVKAMYITHVNDDSDATDFDLLAGDEIVALDDIPVRKMNGQINKDSELGRLLLNRAPGSSLKLGVVARRPRNITMRWPWPPGKVFVHVQKSAGVSMVIDRIAEDSGSWGAGLNPGDEIVKINQLEVQNLGGSSNLEHQVDQFFSRLPREDIRLKVISTSVSSVTLRAFYPSRFERERPAWH